MVQKPLFPLFFKTYLLVRESTHAQEGWGRRKEGALLRVEPDVGLSLTTLELGREPKSLNQRSYRDTPPPPLFFFLHKS